MLTFAYFCLLFRASMGTDGHPRAQSTQTAPQRYPLGKATINLANDLSNESGLLFTTKNLVLNTGGNLLNDHESGIVSKRGILLEINGKIDNKGHIEAKKSISAGIGNTLDNSGSIYSDITEGPVKSTYRSLLFPVVAITTCILSSKNSNTLAKLIASILLISHAPVRVSKLYQHILS